MTAIRVLVLALSLAVGAALGAASPASAQDIFSLQARVMQLEARVREITTFKPVPPPAQGAEALAQRIRTLELTVAELGNALESLRAEIEAMKRDKASIR